MRKSELLDAALRYLLSHGVANASLRPMAAALGTSPRILMFHFKNKEGMLQEVIQELNSRLQGSLQSTLSADQDSERVAPLKQFWKWATSKRNLPYLRLLYEVQIIALQNPRKYGSYLKKASADWHAIALQSMSESTRSASMATLCIAVFDGLMLEFMVTGERRRLTKTLDQFITMASAGGAPEEQHSASIKRRGH
jgi:AcrR family transcriptional regulator